MTRVGIGSIMAGVGYLLVYAAVTDGGKYAKNPWGALKVSWRADSIRA